MTIDLKEREKTMKNHYKIEVADGKYIIMQKDFYFSEMSNENQEYYTEYKTYKTLKGAIIAVKKAIIQHFPKDYFKNDELDKFVKVMI
ncbi:hypothetical protein [Tissierella pigra]|uniref:Uncharacterized protein n=1 Tax=Tissierella pigra TaxID=2607614 RepID=A0A6N7Y3R5_9FIRM|nr:hypothetical protein [Tissierella pigra]MSU03108.1 hypothetical protein [Tissierella pigra]